MVSFFLIFLRGFYFLMIKPDGCVRSWDRGELGSFFVGFQLKYSAWATTGPFPSARSWLAEKAPMG
jgi:hypothetical protein